LPALPEELPDGAAHRLRARPGVEVDLEWAGGVLTAATFTSIVSRTVLVRYGGRVQELHLEPQEATELNLASFDHATRARVK
jgi:alpha-L-fucosidase 2